MKSHTHVVFVDVFDAFLVVHQVFVVLLLLWWMQVRLKKMSRSSVTDLMLIKFYTWWLKTLKRGMKWLSAETGEKKLFFLLWFFFLVIVNVHLILLVSECLSVSMLYCDNMAVFALSVVASAKTQHHPGVAGLTSPSVLSYWQIIKKHLSQLHICRYRSELMLTV